MLAAASLTRRSFVAALLAGLLPGAMRGAAAQAFPSRTVTIVVPFPPAGGADTLARTLAPKLSALWAQTVVIENRPGASGRIGTEQVANAAPDGHTLVMASTAAITEKNIARLAPVALVSAEAYVIVVNSALPIQNVAELIAYAKANPASFASGRRESAPRRTSRASSSRRRRTSTCSTSLTRAPARRSPTCWAARSSSCSRRPRRSFRSCSRGA